MFKLRHNLCFQLDRFLRLGNASDSDSTIAKVDFYANGTLIGTSTSAPYSILYNAASPANLSLTAVATDNNNASSTSTVITFTVTAANVPPTLVKLS